MINEESNMAYTQLPEIVEENSNNGLLEEIQLSNLSDETKERIRLMIEQQEQVKQQKEILKVEKDKLNELYEQLNINDRVNTLMTLAHGEHCFVITENNGSLDIYFISQKFLEKGVNEEDLLSEIEKQIGNEKLIKHLCKSKDGGNQTYYTHDDICVANNTYHLSIHFISEGNFACYLTPFRVFKSDLLDKMHSMLASASIKNPESEEHHERLELYSNYLCRELKNRGLFSDILTEEYIEGIIASARFHDLGKIFVDNNILLKPGPGRLEKDEFEKMKKHTTLGGKLIKREIIKYKDEVIIKLLHIAANIAEFHHEKYDGTGYPKGLVGERIPLEARIIAIADVFDALKAKRVYKEAWSNTEVKAELIRLRGTHFDPIILDVFIELFDKMCEIKESLVGEDEK